MTYQITSENIKVSSSMKSLVSKKFEKVEKLLSGFGQNLGHARFVLSKAPEDGKFKVKILILANGKEYFTDEEEYGFEATLSKAVDEILQMLKKHNKN